MSDTSRAARPTPENAGKGRALIYKAYLDAGFDGMTSNEASIATHLPVIYSQPRISELKASGDLVDTGRRRSNPETGKSAAVLTPTQDALNVGAQSELF